MTWDLTKEQLDAVAEVFLDHDERIAREAAEAAERACAEKEPPAHEE